MSFKDDLEAGSSSPTSDAAEYHPPNSRLKSSLSKANFLLSSGFPITIQVRFVDVIARRRRECIVSGRGGRRRRERQ